MEPNTRKCSIASFAVRLVRFPFRLAVSPFICLCVGTVCRQLEVVPDGMYGALANGMAVKIEKKGRRNGREARKVKQIGKTGNSKKMILDI
eukprot:scaffold211110_cov29-Prasinocladus_malaysianus.AAC.1